MCVNDWNADVADGGEGCSGYWVCIEREQVDWIVDGVEYQSGVKGITRTECPFPLTTHTIQAGVIRSRDRGASVRWTG